MLQFEHKKTGLSFTTVSSLENKQNNYTLNAGKLKPYLFFILKQNTYSVFTIIGISAFSLRISVLLSSIISIFNFVSSFNGCSYFTDIVDVTIKSPFNTRLYKQVRNMKNINIPNYLPTRLLKIHSYYRIVI